MRLGEETAETVGFTAYCRQPQKETLSSIRKKKKNLKKKRELRTWQETCYLHH